MKPSSWLLGGAGLALVAGLIYALMGFFRLSPAPSEESAAGAAKPWLAEAKKKAEALREAQEKIAKDSGEFTGLTSQEGGHRVFVSSQLVYLPANPEPVQPLDRKMKTEDGIEVGWKIKNGFDPADPEVRDLDPDGDGFTNGEEFLAKTDPNKKEDSPAKESKLKSRSGDPVPMVLTFPEKSGGTYSIRLQVGGKRREFKGKPNDQFWVMAGPEAVEVFTEESKMVAARSKAQDGGQNSHVIPLKFISYEEKVEKVKDAKAGGVEVEVDNSFLVLERKDAAAGLHSLIFSTPQRPQTLSWDVGDIRFYTPAGGGVELGPFRVGENFKFEGKEFSVINRDGKKIQLRGVSEPGKEGFWVPPEALIPSSTSPAP